MENEMINTENAIRSKILEIRGKQVMIDRDLAELYGTETKRLNEQVKRNIERFPEDFMFQLNETEFENWRSQFATSNADKMGVRRAPYAFTEHGVTMLASVLKSETAVKASIQIVRAFVAMRHFLQNNAEIFAELKSLRQHQIEMDIHQKEADKRIDELFTLMDKYKIDETQGIFFQGQIFDAYAKFESFIAQAKSEIVLIDGYVDLSVLERLAKKQIGVNVTIYTDPKTKLTAQDVQKFNAQYPTLTVKHTTKMHDRFLIIDNSILYHVGASLKDLGKKCFAFEILDSSLIPVILQNV
ncbi:MAG: ORF6N domain-containing protein [Treponema sp.]|nr:ORF6N domain-containing protein [Treponema sp.]